MIVDDAVVVRGLMARWFAEAGGIEVVSAHRNGSEAVAAIGRVMPDVVVLDIEMPDMDGLTALPLLLQRAPEAVIIIASTLTTRNAEISLKCLAQGAVDYIAKPSSNRDVTFSADFRREVVEKVKLLGARKRRARPSDAGIRRERPSQAPHEAARPSPLEFSLRPMARSRPAAVLIGASTGGPNAIAELIRHCRPSLLKIPFVITQHMPPAFTAMFAEHLRRTLTIDSAEAQDGEPVETGRVYVAPGGRHMRLARTSRGLHVAIDDGPPLNFCKPSVDALFASAAGALGGGALGVMLTGMGSDGLAGARDVVSAGGNIIAQDEASSIVWGMPGAVTRNGLCAAVEPIARLAQVINILSGAGRQ
jgi:two-component system chemotaxis response regulator CheB